MKESNKKPSTSQKSYELKPEYLEDLGAKLDRQRPPKKNRVFFYLGALFILFAIGTVFWFSGSESVIEQNRVAVNDALEKTNENSQITDNEDVKSKIPPDEIQIENTANKLIKNYESDEFKTKVVSKGNREKKTKATEIGKRIENRVEHRETLKGRKAIEKVVGLRDKLKENFKGFNQESGKEKSLEESNDKSFSISSKVELEPEAIEKKNPRTILEAKKQVNENSLVYEQENTKADGVGYIDNDTIVSAKEDSILAEKSSDEPIKVSEDTAEAKKVNAIEGIEVILPAPAAKWQLSLLSGANISFSNLKNADNSIYLEKRKQEENSLTSFSAGFSVDRFITKSIKISSGINYLTVGSNNKYAPVNSFRNESQFNGFDSVYNPTIDSIFFNPTRRWIQYTTGGDSIADSSFVNRRVAFQDSTAHLASAQVKFSYVELPLTIGYFRVFNKWSFGMNTGIGIGLLTRSSGSYINEDLVSTEVAQSQKIIWNYILGPEINYQLNNKYYIGFQSDFRMGLNNLSISETIERKYYNIQFSGKIGVRF
ncbi:MAG: hypothetical protein ABF242_10005 [Flavobacteriales bacterium]